MTTDHATTLDPNDPELYKRFFRDSTDAIVITDAGGKILSANPAWCELYGYTLEEVLGSTTSIIRSAHTSEEMYRYMWSGITDRAVGYWKGEIVNRKKNGEDVPVLLTITPIRSGDEIVGYTGLGIDISERKRFEELRELYDMVIRHDLKAPLGSILALSANLVSGYAGPLSPRATDVVTRVLRLAERMQEMIATSLDLEKLRRGVLRLDLEPVDIFALVRSSSETLEDLASRRGVRVDPTWRSGDFDTLDAVDTTDAGDTPKPEATQEGDATPKAQATPEYCIHELDPIHLQRAVENLLKNAIEAAPAGSAVTVTAGRWDGATRIRVHNGGAPIPPDVRATLFHPFSTYGKRGGTGLGIYGVKMAVEAMGGSLSYDTGEKGTTFEAAFPVPASKLEHAPEE